MPRSKAKGKAATTRKRSARRQEQEFLQTLYVELIHLRAAVLTSVLALDGSGVHDNIAILLRGHSLARLAPLMEKLDELAHK